MGQLYCFSCGKPLSDTEQDRASSAGPVPICDSCRAAGPQLAAGDVRWMVRHGEERPQGPLSRDGVMDRLARDLLGPYDQVCRVNAEWQRLVEHPDFRASFIPGTPERASLDRLRKELSEAKSVESRRRRRKFAAATALLIVGLVLPAITITTGFGVLPESWLTLVKGGVSTAKQSVSRAVSGATDEDKAKENAARAAGLPGAAVVSELRERYPTVEDSMELLIAQGQAGLWRGTAASLGEAKLNFEKAVAVAPDDPEATGGLALAYAALLQSEKGQLVAVVDLAERTAALAPGSVTAQRTQAAVALLTGDQTRALQLATACLAAGEAKAQDLGCAGIKAAAQGDDEALATLEARYPSATPLTLARAHLALRRKDWGLALRLGRTLAKRFPEDAEPGVIVFQAAVAIGDWREASETGTKLIKRAPYRPDLLALLGEIRLKVEEKPAEALAVLQPLAEQTDRGGGAARTRLLADTATAALAAGKAELALNLADQTLALEAGNLAATLVKARALDASGKRTEVEPLLAGVDINHVLGREGARYFVGVGRLYTKVGNAKSAATAIDAALDLDPSYVPAHLDRAAAWLAAGNASAAVDQIKAIPQLDVAEEAARSPLVAVWLPDSSWAGLRKDLEVATRTDARLAVDAPAVLAILAWAARMPDAQSALTNALADNRGAKDAHAALGWLLVDRGEAGAALPHLDLALAANPESGILQALRARALGMLGRMDEANLSFTKALVHAGKVATVYRWRADVRRRSGDTAGALADLAQARKLDPEDLAALAAEVALKSAAK